jgi:hypothetical protein
VTLGASGQITFVMNTFVMNTFVMNALVPNAELRLRYQGSVTEPTGVTDPNQSNNTATDDDPISNSTFEQGFEDE